MERLIESIKKTVEEEYERAAATYGRQHSTQQEAYAVIREEFQETCESVNEMGELIEERFWQNVRNDNVKGNFTVAKNIYNAAVLAACEAIQVAAMAHKAMQGYEKQEVAYE